MMPSSIIGSPSCDRPVNMGPVLTSCSTSPAFAARRFGTPVFDSGLNKRLAARPRRVAVCGVMNQSGWPATDSLYASGPVRFRHPSTVPTLGSMTIWKSRTPACVAIVTLLLAEATRYTGKLNPLNQVDDAPSPVFSVDRLSLEHRYMAEGVSALATSTVVCPCLPTFKEAPAFRGLSAICVYARPP